MKLREILAVLGLSACAADSAMPALAPHVDLERYAGRWYIIANIPYFAERGRVGSYFDVTVDGRRFSDEYVGRKDFSAKPFHFTMRGYVRDGFGNAWWRELPLWPFHFSYLIVHVDAQYRTAVVGYPGMRYGWLLARTPEIDDAEYAGLLEAARVAGYDPALFRKVPQLPEQVGREGFQ